MRPLATSQRTSAWARPLEFPALWLASMYSATVMPVWYSLYRSFAAPRFGWLVSTHGLRTVMVPEVWLFSDIRPRHAVTVGLAFFLEPSPRGARFFLGSTGVAGASTGVTTWVSGSTAASMATSATAAFFATRNLDFLGFAARSLAFAKRTSSCVVITRFLWFAVEHHCPPTRPLKLNEGEKATRILKDLG